MADIKKNDQWGVRSFDQDEMSALGIGTGLGGFEARSYTAHMPLPESAYLARLNAEERQEELEIRAAIQEEDAINAFEVKIDEVGAFAKPGQDNLRSHKKLLRQGGGVNNIEFSPYDYGSFDYIIAHRIGADEFGKLTHPAFNQEDENYPVYAPLRRNLAILRNYIMVNMFPDGEFEPEGDSEAAKQDRKNLQKVKDIAEYVADALIDANDSKQMDFFESIGNFFSSKRKYKPDFSNFLDLANVPDKGLVYLYDHVLAIQRDNSILDWLPFRTTPRDWQLPERQNSPFSDYNMANFSNAATMTKVVDSFDRVTSHCNSVDSLSKRDKEISIQEARYIIEKLRVEIDESSVFTIEIKDDRQAIARMSLKVAYAFRNALSDIAKSSPNLLTGDPDIIEAVEALGHMNYRFKNYLADMFKEENNSQGTEIVINNINSGDDRFKTNEQEVPLIALVDKLQKGMEAAYELAKNLPLNISQTPQYQGYDTFETAKVTGINQTGLLEAANDVNNTNAYRQGMGR